MWCSGYFADVPWPPLTWTTQPVQQQKPPYLDAKEDKNVMIQNVKPNPSPCSPYSPVSPIQPLGSNYCIPAQQTGMKRLNWTSHRLHGSAPASFQTSGPGIVCVSWDLLWCTCYGAQNLVTTTFVQPNSSHQNNPVFLSLCKSDSFHRLKKTTRLIFHSFKTDWDKKCQATWFGQLM